MIFTLPEVLGLCTALLLALFVIALASAAPLRYTSNRLLIGLLSVNGLLVLLNVLRQHGLFLPADLPGLYLASMALFFTIPPLLYGYIVHLLSPPTALRLREARHLLPAALGFMVLGLLYGLRAVNEPPAFPIDYATAVGFMVVLHSTFLAYFALACRRVWQRRLGTVVQAKAGAPTRWAAIILGIFGVHWFFGAAGGILALARTTPSLLLLFEVLAMVPLLGFCALATYLGMRQLPLLVHPGKPRYSGSAIDTSALHHHTNRLRAYLEEAKPYLDPALTAEALARALGLTPRQLSQVLNDGCGSSFFEVINGYRVAEAQRLLRDPQWTQATILEVLYEAGFNSKSAFNRAFKQRTGLTPTAYRRDAARAARPPSKKVTL